MPGQDKQQRSLRRTPQVLFLDQGGRGQLQCVYLLKTHNLFYFTMEPKEKSDSILNKNMGEFLSSLDDSISRGSKRKDKNF